jgi:uncharacterized protein YndB with AHSA1/START domain
MTGIVKEIIINAPPEKIYNLIIKSSNLTKLWPSLVAVKNERLLPNQGYSATWVYRMAGIDFEGKAECIDVVPNKRFSVKIEGALNCTLTCTLQTIDNIRTKVTITLDYQAHFPLFNWLAANIAVKRNDREAELVLNNLRQFMEKNESLASE